ncbi:13271_t:CDS:2, partial [Racocetra persica]
MSSRHKIPYQTHRNVVSTHSHHSRDSHKDTIILNRYKHRSHHSNRSNRSFSPHHSRGHSPSPHHFRSRSRFPEFAKLQSEVSLLAAELNKLKASSQQSLDNDFGQLGKKLRRKHNIKHMFSTQDKLLYELKPHSWTVDEFKKNLDQIIEVSGYYSDEVSETDIDQAAYEVEKENCTKDDDAVDDFH